MSKCTPSTSCILSNSHLQLLLFAPLKKFLLLLNLIQNESSNSVANTMVLFQVLSHVVEGPVAQNTSLCFRLSYPSPQPFSFSSSLSRLSRLYNISILISDINFSYFCWSNFSFGCGIHEQKTRFNRSSVVSRSSSSTMIFSGCSLSNWQLLRSHLFRNSFQ